MWVISVAAVVSMFEVFDGRKLGSMNSFAEATSVDAGTCFWLTCVEPGDAVSSCCDRRGMSSKEV